MKDDGAMDIAIKFGPGEPRARIALTEKIRAYGDKRAAEAASPAAGWQPIDTAPKDGQYILAYDKTGIYMAAWHSRWNMNGWVRYGSGEGWPTHWMPLPAPPLAAPSEEARAEPPTP